MLIKTIMTRKRSPLRNVQCTVHTVMSPDPHPPSPAPHHPPSPDPPPLRPRCLRTRTPGRTP